MSRGEVMNVMYITYKKLNSKVLNIFLDFSRLYDFLVMFYLEVLVEFQHIDGIARALVGAVALEHPAEGQDLAC